MPQLTPEQHDEIIALFKAGHSSAEIAEQLDVNPPVVWGVKAHWTISKRETQYVEHLTVAGANAAEIERALSVLQAMAAGVDPLTGEVLPEESVLQQPQVIRALYCAVRTLEFSRNAVVSSSVDKQRQRTDRVLPENAGKPWSEAEDARLCKHFDAGTPVHDIAQAHGRTRGSITSRLVRLGKIEARNIADAALESNRQV